MPQLVFSRGSQPLFQVKVQSSSIKIGRSESCDVVLGDPDISREHASLFNIEGAYLIKKEGKREVFINGEELKEQPKPLREGDEIQIGSWLAKFGAGFDQADLEVTQGGGNSASQKTQAVASSRGFLVQNLSLQLSHPSQGTSLYPLTEGTLTLGADEQNNIVLDDPYASGRHLKLVIKGDEVSLFDLGSTNGTFVNEVRVQQALLEPGMRVKIGQCVLQLIEEDQIESIKPIETNEFCGLVGASSKMQELYGMLSRVGPTEATVLILGESGSGKELVSRAVHALSPRNQGPFIALNCGAISKELIESELFGHEKGAFTGAGKQHEGSFGQAKGGTLFLDEVGELPLDLQPKLLRVLENQTYRRVGGSQELKSDARIVAATHRDLSELVKQGRFREDLFFRLFVLPMYLPALRERMEDLPLLAEAFLKEFSPSGHAKQLSEETLLKLMSHTYPGNVRELRNILLRSVLLSKEEMIKPEEIFFADSYKSNPDESVISGIEKLEDMERKLILKALVAHKWNKAKAAESLGIAKSTLFSKIKLYELDDPKRKAS
ncbi:MAG: sigma 54-interacting transcriptional regulator [Deltaproteobacteria bacterium]|nr:sigma 54-interacting transcriptional regulator [Deltaproteobacteria bacterium]